jgi:hypothetical protein
MKVNATKLESPRCRSQLPKIRDQRLTLTLESYLHYIRRQNAIVDGATNVEEVRTTITKAYEFALKECGVDRESGELWQEYIDFLAAAKVGDPFRFCFSFLFSSPSNLFCRFDKTVCTRGDWPLPGPVSEQP